MDIKQWHQDLEELFPKMVEIRRDLHQHPELAYQEVRTAKIIADYLEDLGIEVRTKVGGNGVLGTIKGGKPGKTVAIRADFDALPIQDEKDVEYKSTIPNKMHACGHDGHTATLLGVATVLAKHRDDLEGNVVLIHQHAEEDIGGAEPMIADGCLEGVDVVFGTHLSSTTPLGEISCSPGYVMAATDFFDIVINGKGGHGASPHQTVDPIVTASQLVMNLQQIISRNVDPIESGVVTVGSFHSGEAPNVIADSAKITGTVRTYLPEVRDLIENRISQIANAICEGNDATCEVQYHRGYDAVWNHPAETKYLQEVASEIIGEENVIEGPPSMGGEDYGYFMQKVPGTFFHTGAALSDASLVYPHHHPRFDFDEDAMKIAGKILLSAVAKVNDADIGKK
ncbi:M20 family metallopeptidase [Ornithinibacillus sp. 4-3]|uniref:M20 family metallopeptidase n=1 Tax=Ornithinibacillus sp. 4-3 TaxID=3231488 RepID=A0AB39HRP2_9BACI